MLDHTVAKQFQSIIDNVYNIDITHPCTGEVIAIAGAPITEEKAERIADAYIYTAAWEGGGDPFAMFAEDIAPYI